MKSPQLFWLGIIWLILTLACSAQKTTDSDDYEQAIQSDRPLLIQAPDLENNEQQIEFGVLISRDRDGTPTKVSFPVLYRIDTGPDTEFRLEADLSTIQGDTRGFSDISLGMKWQIGPSTSLVGRLQLPTGSSAFTDNGVEPTLLLVQDIPLSERWEMGLNAGITINRDEEDLEYYGQFILGADISYALTPKTEFTASLLLQSPDELHGIDRLTGLVGISHALNDANALQLNVGRSFSSTGDDFIVILGWSRRI